MFLLVFVEINKFSAAGMHFLELVRCSNLTFASVLRIQDVFIPDLGSYMKSGMQTYFFLASYGFSSKVLDLVIVKNVRDPGKIHPGSGYRG
jgi:hypothetical protein